MSPSSLARAGSCSPLPCVLGNTLTFEYSSGKQWMPIRQDRTRLITALGLGLGFAF